MRAVIPPSRGPGWRRAAAAGLAGAAFAVACGTGGPSPVASSPATGVLCRDAAALRASLSRLTSVKVSASTVSDITAGVSDAQAELRTFAADAKGQWQAQTTALSSSLSTLSSAVRELASQPSTSTVSAVVIALGGVSTAARGLLAAVSADCPSVSPPPGSATPAAS